MRNSPIRGLNSISPFKTSVILRSDRKQLLQNSPDRLNSNLNDIQYWRLKTRQLEVQLQATNEQRILNSRRIEGVADMEDKIDMLLRQNNHIMEENQTLLQFIQQKKSQNDALRLQLDAGGVALERETRKANVSLNILDQEHKIQIQKLLSEITRLQDQIEQIQNLKRIQIDGIKSKYQADAIQQIQNLRRSQQGNNQLLELNIRNLKDTIQQKSIEIQRYRKELKLQAQRATGQSSFLRNEIKKIEQQKQNEFELYQAEHENNVKNLNQTSKKNEEEMKNLYQIKIRRLGYQIQKKKNDIQQNLSKFKKTGKEAEQQIAILLQDKAQLRRDIKDSDTLRLKQLQQLTSFYEAELQNNNKNAEVRQENTRKHLQGEVLILRKIIESKQTQNQSLMVQIQTLKQNENIKINNLTTQKDHLEKKIVEMIHHYQRQIQLLKIKTSKLYEADLEALRNQLENQISLLASQNGKLKDGLKQSRDHLVSELEEKVIMRRDYQTRLREMNIKYQRQHQQLNELILMAEKKFENAHSATSIRDIEHTAKTKKQNTSFQTIFAQKRNLETQIANKNKQIETLNLRIQKMQGHHEKQISDLEKRASEQNLKYNESLSIQNNLLKTQVQHQQDLQKKYRELQEKHRQKQKQWNDKLNLKNKELEDKGLKIANLQGIVQEMKKHHGILDSKIKVEVGNIERTNLEMTVLMNQQKQRLQKIRQSDKEGIRVDFQERMKQLRNQIKDLNNLIQNLRASYQAQKVKSRSLEKQLNDSLKQLDQKGKLQQHVINIGLSNNYFKNVTEIFRKQL